MKAFMQKIDALIEPLRRLADFIAAPLYDLTARLYVSYAFFNSGWGRFQNYLDGDWSSQLFLFKLEHPVPGVPAEVAAPLTTAMELVLPVLVTLGLFGRFGAAGMLVMTAIIEFTYTHNTHHILWFFLAGSIFIKGPGAISVDNLLRRWLTPRYMRS